MTPEEAVALAAPHRLIIHKRQVFFNTRDYAEALDWERRGSHITPHYDLDEIERRRAKGREVVPGWEVHLLGACERIEEEDADGDLVDITVDALLNAARAS